MSVENKTTWNLLLVAAILAGGAATFMIVNREKYFPEQYAASASHHEADSVHAEADHDDGATDPETTQPVAEETPSVTKVASAEPTPRLARYALIAGSFSSEENAVRMKDEISGKPGAENTAIFRTAVDGKDYFRVVVRADNSYRALRKLQDDLTTGGVTGCWIAVQ